MKKKDAVKYWGSEVEIARTLKISRQAVNKWGKIVPINAAVKLAHHSAGDLDVVLRDYR